MEKKNSAGQTTTASEIRAESGTAEQLAIETREQRSYRGRCSTEPKKRTRAINNLKAFSTLSVSAYRFLWASLTPEGDSCKLEVYTPTLLGICDHLTGFHVVFATSPLRGMQK
jgi:hypothetical protein